MGHRSGGASGALAIRARRYLRLREAERALAFATRFRHSLSTAAAARELSGRLVAALQRAGGAALPDPPSGGDGSRAIASDPFLARYAGRLQQVVDATPVAQLRASLPGAIEVARHEVVALLDLCLEDAGLAQRRLDLVDYLVTALSTRSEAGVEIVVSDPAQLSPRIRAIARAVARQGDRGVAAVAERFRETIAELIDLEDVHLVVQEMRALKRSLGAHYFHPQVLRAVVEYNAAVANHLQALIDAERAMDKEVRAALPRA